MPNSAPSAFWNVELHGNPPGSRALRCPSCLRSNNWYAAQFTPEEDEQVLLWRLQAAYRVRAALQGVEFYAKRAKAERQRSGSEMPYWIAHQGSEMTLERAPPGPESVVGLTPEDLPDAFPTSWLRQVERIMLHCRGSAITASDTGVA